jgi:PAS domain S-box-containing protein
MVASSNDAIMAQSTSGIIESWNAGAERLYGYTAEEAIGRHRALAVPPDYVDPVVALVDRLVRGERVEDCEAIRQRKDGTLIDVSIRLSPIHDDSGAVTGVSAIARDITAAKEAERRLKASLQEKEVLLKEVHHRVKNNLQVISSLLNIEAGRMTNPEAVTAFRKSQTRVRSIAAFHEGVYQAADLAHVDMARYIGDLLRGLRATYGLTGDGVSVTVDAASVELSADVAIPCGLIANELITNAFKHAFPGGRGTISVTFQQADDHLVLRVADDGVGLPSSFDLSRLDSLGLQLVQTLSEQIGGAVGVERGARGVAFSVKFKAANS